MEVTRGLHAFIWRDFQINNCNTYLISGSKHILIDPGLFQVFGNVGGGLSSIGLRLNQIDLVVITHGHFDHFDAAGEFEGIAPVAMALKECEFLAATAGPSVRTDSPGLFQPDIFLEEGELVAGDIKLNIISAPGHSPGSLCIYWPDRKALFSGDVIFDHGVGRTDLPGGSGSMLKRTIRNIAQYDIEYLLPGHGEIVAGKEKVRRNFEEVEKTWFSYLSE